MLIDIANCQIKDPRVDSISVYIINNQYCQALIDKFDARISIIKCGRRVGSRSFLPIVKLNYELFKFKPDILHFHAAEISKIVFVFGTKVLTVHNTGYNPDTGSWFKACFAISEAVKNDWAKKGVKTKVVANGISCREINVKNSFWDGESAFKIIQVSRILFVQKGQDIALQAIAGLKAKGISNIQLSFVGDGEDYDSLAQMIDEYGLKDSVVLEGVKDRDWIYQHLQEYDLFLQPSRFEGFGLTVAEACAAKLPVLVSDNEGPLEIIDNGKFGTTFRNKDVDDLKMKILAIMRDYQKLIPIADKARDHVLHLYDISKTASKYVDEYQDVLK